MNRLIALATALVVSLAATNAGAGTINPNDMRGLRDFGGSGAFLLSFSSVIGATEDRTIAHFDISGLTNPVTDASLSLSMQNQDIMLSSTLDIHSFAGDGTVSVDEWNSGSLFTSLTGLVGPLVNPVVDITSLLNTAIGNGDGYLSFNLRNGPGEGRFFFSHVIGGTYGTSSSAGPTVLSYDMPTIPLPAGLPLLLAGLSGLGLMARRKRKAA